MDTTPEPNKRSLMEEKVAKLRARGVTIVTSRGPIVFIPPEKGNGYIPSGSDPALIRLQEKRNRLSQDETLPLKLIIFQRLLEQKKKKKKMKKISPSSPCHGNQKG